MQDILQNQGVGMPRIAREQLTLNRAKNAKPEAQLYRLRDAAVPGLLLRAPTGRHPQAHRAHVWVVAQGVAGRH